MRLELRSAGIAQNDLLQRPADGELDHGTGPHVDAVGTDATVQLPRVEGEGLALLEHVLPVVETLEAQDLDDADGHAHRGILQFVQFGRHGFRTIRCLSSSTTTRPVPIRYALEAKKPLQVLRKRGGYAAEEPDGAWT